MAPEVWPFAQGMNTRYCPVAAAGDMPDTAAVVVRHIRDHHNCRPWRLYARWVRYGSCQAHNATLSETEQLLERIVAIFALGTQ